MCLECWLSWTKHSVLASFIIWFAYNFDSLRPKPCCPCAQTPGQWARCSKGWENPGWHQRAPTGRSAEWAAVTGPGGRRAWLAGMTSTSQCPRSSMQWLCSRSSCVKAVRLRLFINFFLISMKRRKNLKTVGLVLKDGLLPRLNACNIISGVVKEVRASPQLRPLWCS